MTKTFIYWIPFPKAISDSEKNLESGLHSEYFSDFKDNFEFNTLLLYMEKKSSLIFEVFYI